ncbi:hypothetical protein VTI74DRAFT_837 [Chaetomium olivicolor]
MLDTAIPECPPADELCRMRKSLRGTLGTEELMLGAFQFRGRRRSMEAPWNASRRRHGSGGSRSKRNSAEPALTAWYGPGPGWQHAVWRSESVRRAVPFWEFACCWFSPFGTYVNWFGGSSSRCLGATRHQSAGQWTDMPAAAVCARCQRASIPMSCRPE